MTVLEQLRHHMCVCSSSDHHALSRKSDLHWSLSAEQIMPCGQQLAASLARSAPAIIAAICSGVGPGGLSGAAIGVERPGAMSTGNACAAGPGAGQPCGTDPTHASHDAPMAARSAQDLPYCSHSAHVRVGVRPGTGVGVRTVAAGDPSFFRRTYAAAAPRPSQRSFIRGGRPLGRRWQLARRQLGAGITPSAPHRECDRR
jgi:hypothetical protein